jgi:hypothetical protein
MLEIEPGGGKDRNINATTRTEEGETREEELRLKVSSQQLGRRSCDPLSCLFFLGFFFPQAHFLATRRFQS